MCHVDVIAGADDTSDSEGGLVLPAGEPGEVAVKLLVEGAGDIFEVEYRCGACRVTFPEFPTLDAVCVRLAVAVAVCDDAVRVACIGAVGGLGAASLCGGHDAECHKPDPDASA